MTDEESTLGERVRQRRDRAATRPLRRPGVPAAGSRLGPAPQEARAGTGHEAESRKKKKNMRPAEMPINARPRPYVGRGERAAPEKKSMDPRFEEHCGKFNQGHFERTYAFAEDLRTDEKESVRAQLSKTKNPTLKEELKLKLQALEDQTENRAAARRRTEIQRKFKAEEREKVKHGKKPYFLSERKLRDMEMQAKYDDLKKTGKLKKYMEKRRKKVAQKDKRMLPS